MDDNKARPTQPSTVRVGAKTGNDSGTPAKVSQTRRASSSSPQGTQRRQTSRAAAAKRPGDTGGSDQSGDWRKSASTTFIFAIVIVGGALQLASENYKVTAAFAIGVGFTLCMRWRVQR